MSASDSLIISDSVGIEKGNFIKIVLKENLVLECSASDHKILLQNEMLLLQFPLLLLTVSSCPLPNKK